MPDPTDHDHHTADPDSGHDHGRHDHDDAAANHTSLLDLDAEVLHDYWSSALDFVAAASKVNSARLVDLGAGTGTGAMGLAERFPTAEVVALDLSETSLSRLHAKATAAGLASRVRALVVDIDDGWPELGVLDLTWASMSLHHFADPTQVLRDVLSNTRPGGLIAVAEFEKPIRFLPDDLGVGRPGLEDRISVVLGAAHAEAMPSLGSAWAPRLTTAGWEVIDERDFVIDLNPPRHLQATTYAHLWFSRLADGLTDQLTADDQETLTQLLDNDSPHALLSRTDLHLRGVRTVTLGRRT